MVFVNKLSVLRIHLCTKVLQWGSTKVAMAQTAADTGPAGVVHNTQLNADVCLIPLFKEVRSQSGKQGEGFAIALLLVKNQDQENEQFTGGGEAIMVK